MDIGKIFNEYLIQLNQIILSQRKIKEMSQNEIESLIAMKRKEEEFAHTKSTSHSINFFYILDAKTGEMIRHDFIKSTIDDQIKQIIIYKNMQYQWVLSQSFEIFREFLLKSYAYIGFKNKNIWPLKDFGNIFLNELDNKDFNYFYEQAKNKKGAPESIMNSYRSLFLSYAKIESTNKINRNLHLEINLIEEFRHIIVHCSGVSVNKHETIEKILKRTGLFNNGKYDKVNYNYILSYFNMKEFENTICLLEIILDPKFGKQSSYNDKLSDLINSLIAATYFIHNEIKNLVE